MQPSPRPTNPHPDPHVLTRLVFAHWSETCNMRTCRSGGGAFKTQALRVAKKPQEWDMHAFNASRSPHRHHASKATAGSWARSVSWTRVFQPAGGSCQSMILRSYCMDVLWALRTGRCVLGACVGVDPSYRRAPHLTCPVCIYSCTRPTRSWWDLSHS